MIDILEAVRTSFILDKKYQEAEKRGFHPIDRKLYNQFNRFRTNGPKQLFCYLPYNSLTFSFGGQVFVCSYNRDVQLGKYPNNTIDEIWNGQEARKLREYMWYNDLDYGCRHCKYFFDKGKFTNLRPLVFDKYYKNVDAMYPQVFEFELSNECNLECQMCHGEVSSSIRKNRDKLPPLPMVYDDAFVAQLERYIPRLKEAKFYGGEPFLISIYYKIWDKIKELNPGLELFVITNGMHWNKKIESLINELNFDVAISIDAFDKEKLERIRKNVIHEKLMENIHRFSEVCNRKGKHMSLSFTVQKDNWEQLPLIIDLCNKVNAYIYISYLERPIQFVLTTLPKSELQRIREYMNQFSFPRLSQKERHNARCFEDFKHYLDTYIENMDTKKYHEYEFAQEVKRNEEKAKAKVIKTGNSSDFKTWIHAQYLQDAKLSEVLAERDLLKQLEEIFTVYTEREQHLLQGMIMQGEFDPFLTSMKTLSIEELKTLSDQSLQEYKNAEGIAAEHV
jgi:radical SAM protein with 4Fe4S-binding SPASM domain